MAHFEYTNSSSPSLSLVHFLIEFVIYSYYPSSYRLFIERSLIRRRRQSVLRQFYLSLPERIHVVAKVFGVLVLLVLGGVGSYGCVWYSDNALAEARHVGARRGSTRNLRAERP